MTNLAQPNRQSLRRCAARSNFSRRVLPRTVLMVRAIYGAFSESFLISPKLANVHASSDETGSPLLVLLDGLASRLDSERRAVLFAEA